LLAGIDYFMIGVSDLARSVEAYRRIGFDVQLGGAHASGGTENAIAFLQEDYLELLALRAAQSHEARAGLRQFLAGGDGLRYLAVQSDDLAADVAAMRARGVDVSEVANGGPATPARAEPRVRGASP